MGADRGGGAGGSGHPSVALKLDQVGPARDGRRPRRAAGPPARARSLRFGGWSRGERDHRFGGAQTDARGTPDRRVCVGRRRCRGRRYGAQATEPGAEASICAPSTACRMASEAPLRVGLARWVRRSSSSDPVAQVIGHCAWGIDRGIGVPCPSRASTSMPASRHSGPSLTGRVATGEEGSPVVILGT